jgi:hypothetical protein
MKEKLEIIKQYIEKLEDALIELKINPSNLQTDMNCNQDPLDMICDMIEES